MDASSRISRMRTHERERLRGRPRLKMMEWWYQSAEERMSAPTIYPPPPPPPAPKLKKVLNCHQIEQYSLFAQKSVQTHRCLQYQDLSSVTVAFSSIYLRGRTTSAILVRQARSKAKYK